MTTRREILGGAGLLALTALTGAPIMTQAAALTADPAPEWSFESIYGGTYDSKDFAGKAILLVNTASLCGYTPQYTALQKLQDTYKDQGLVVFAVPSDDFHQEKNSNGEVKAFCELNYGITMPMAVISKVTGDTAHPLYKWLWAKAKFAPEWNFNKVLFDRTGRVVATWRSGPEPMGGEIEATVQKVLAQA